MNLYIVKDMKDNFKSYIYPMPNDEYAIRSIPEIRKVDPLYTRYPHDFVLYKIGTLDQESGHIDALDVPAFIADLSYGIGGDDNADLA